MSCGTARRDRTCLLLLVTEAQSLDCQRRKHCRGSPANRTQCKLLIRELRVTNPSRSHHVQFESREGIEPSLAVLQTSILATSSAHVTCFERIRGIEPLSSVWKTNFQPLDTRVALSEVGGVGRNRTGNLFDAIEALSSLSYDPIHQSVERPGVAPGSLLCESSILLLNYRPLAGCEGIEPSLPSFGGSKVAMTLQPVSAPRTGIEPVSILRQRTCDASRITRQSVLRARVRGHSRRRRQGVLGRIRTCV
jgi:hypothetical protein